MRCLEKRLDWDLELLPQTYSQLLCWGLKPRAKNMMVGMDRAKVELRINLKEIFELEDCLPK
jgi:hypothetical protein